MKQRIRVVALIRDRGRVLLMKRARSRIDGEPVWELPTGKIKFGEQPEEAMARVLEEFLSIKQTETVVLRDVVTFVAPQGASQLSNLYIIYDVELMDGTEINPKERYSVYKYTKEDEVCNLCMDGASLSVLEIEDRVDGVRSNYKEVANSATVYVDGCSRGNPGPSGVGYHIVGENGEVLASDGEFIGFATSRIAEYYALKAGIEKALELGLRSVRFVGDNLMMINQMNGVYKIKNRDLIPIYDDIQELLKQFEACAFVHVLREQNREADRQANLAVDRRFDLDN